MTKQQTKPTPQNQVDRINERTDRITEKELARKPQQESWETGFPFGKTTIEEIIRKCELHSKNPSSEIFEFYTKEYAGQAISKIISTERTNLLNEVRELVEGMSAMTLTNPENNHPANAYKLINKADVLALLKKDTDTKYRKEGGE